MSNPGAPWEPVRRERNYEHVMAQIEKRLLEGQLLPGDQLPSERQLSTQLGISRSSLREALRVLEALGIIDIRLGGGPESGAVVRKEPGLAFGDLLRLELALGHFSPVDILNTRLTIEEWSSWHAARHATAEEVEQMSALLDAMEDPALTVDEYTRMDEEFHNLIAAAARNPLNVHVLGSLRNAIHQRMVERYAAMSDWKERTVTLNAEHRRLLEAIKAGESDLARSLVREFIASFYELDPAGSYPHDDGAEPSSHPVV